jgi:hypothetical protein
MRMQVVHRNPSGSYPVITCIDKLEENKLKTTLLIFLMASSVLAQAQTREARLAPSCGPDAVKFEVKTEKNPHGMGQPDAGKALVYFLEDDSEFGSFPKPTTRVGLDGGWVGATHGNSYFYFSLDPGEHHLCACWQTAVLVGQGHKVAAAHFTAEAGGVYYFRVKDTWVRDMGTASISLEPLDSDEGQLLTRKYSFSTFQQKK